MSERTPEGYKIGYSYDVITGELINEEIVYLEKATGTYPCAGNVTFKRPPETEEHEVAVFDPHVDAWRTVPDWRGFPWWDAEGNLGGIIEDIGKAAGITEEPPEKGDHERLNWVNGAWQKKLMEGWISDKATGDVREMTQVEKIYAGLEDIPVGCKLENGEILPKTRDDLWAEGAITLEEYNEQVQRDRESEYRRTTDKIGLMVMRGEATMEEWQAAIADIKARYPKKESAE